MHDAPLSLDDKYALRSGSIFLSGTQALVRLALEQSWRDADSGLNTAGFVTGYRGSPLGGLDQALERARGFIDRAEIRFQPGVNEDIAATAVRGTQEIALLHTPKKDGVFALWYGKGPGVDRSGDAFRHGNLVGTAPHGGVLLLAGDDHTCKSSTTSHQSEFAFVDSMIPVLNAAGIDDILEFGLHGWALSRYSGCWTALKLAAEIVDTSATIHIPAARPLFVTPTDFAAPPGGLNARWPDTPQEQERRLHTAKLPAVAAFARANRIDRVVLGGARRRIGIVTAGKSYLDLRQALDELGLSAQRAAELGLAIYKIGMVWPLEPRGLIEFAATVDELFVVEEKRPLIEHQIKEILYNLPADRRPRVYGKYDPDGRPLLQSHDELHPQQIARALAPLILRRADDADLRERAARLDAVAAANALDAEVTVRRTPYFCSGCPHSSSTKVPVGSRALAGIGCHWMAQSMNRDTATYTHMGGEGANWIGQAPFVETPHIFQNIGDGTYFHSGALSIRAAIAAKINITYKILFNDAVAMTGGQRHDGDLTPQRISHQVRAEGVARIAIVSYDIVKYRGQAPFASGATIHHRDDLDAVQRELREVPGTTVLIYDQLCAAEKRRRRKRSTLPEPARRVVINELVCEGCGDCSTQSNCLSVTPLETEFGAKRRIDQSSCNKDFSCLNGFCPSFVTVEGGKPHGATSAAGDVRRAPMVDPTPPALTQPYNVLVTGVGGTGVVTIGAVLATAAHMEGKACLTLDMAGLAQKGGPVATHLRIAAAPDQLHAVRIGGASADLVLGCDMVVTGGRETLALMEAGRTRIVLNSEEIITADFIQKGGASVPGPQIIAALRDKVGDQAVAPVAAGSIAADLLGDSIAANLLMVGFAYQKGLIPLAAESIAKAIELNGAAVRMNLAAFRLGRELAAGPAPVAAAKTPVSGPPTLEQLVERRAEFLTDYQNEAYAATYIGFMSRVAAREKETLGSSGEFSAAVARSLFKLMAYKDEYEVARLHTGGAFRRQLGAMFDGEVKLAYHLAPPLLARRDPVTGVPRKMRFGGWMGGLFRLLAASRFLRATPFDPFGHTVERRQERALIEEFRATIDRLLPALSPARYDAAIAIARLPLDIKGFGHIKQANVAAARNTWAALERDFHDKAAPTAHANAADRALA